jgi:hypothetical protein
MDNDSEALSNLIKKATADPVFRKKLFLNTDEIITQFSISRELAELVINSITEYKKAYD